MPGSLPHDIASGSSPRRRLRRVLRRCRSWVERHPRIRWTYRLAVGLLGTLIAIIGILLVPLPGPGWLIVFLGLAVLGTEFPAAHRAAAFMKRILTRAWDWWRSRRAARST